MMPIVNEDEDLIKNKETPVGGGTSYIGGGASSAGAASGSTAAPSKVSSAPGFTNLQTYLGGDQASNQMGGHIADQGNELGGTATTAVNTFSNGVIGAANAGVPVLNKGSAERPGYSGPQSYNEGTYGVNSGLADSAVKDANTYANMSKDAGGIQNQLKDMTPGKYSQGENALDAATVTSGFGRNQVQDMQNNWSGLSGYLDSARTGATNAIGDAKKRSDTVTAQWGAAQDAKALKDKTDREAKEAKDKVDLDARNKANKTGYIVSNNPISSPSNSGTVTSTIPTQGYTGALAIQPPADAGTLEYQQPNATVGRNTRYNDPNNYPFLGQFMLNR